MRIENLIGYRRSKQNVRATRDWSDFVRRNRRVIEAAGLPEVVTESINHWDDFLMHGFLDHHLDISHFGIERLSEEQYAALLQLVESYFEEGYEYFPTIALRNEDREQLEMRYRTK